MLNTTTCCFSLSFAPFVSKLLSSLAFRGRSGGQAGSNRATSGLNIHEARGAERPLGDWIVRSAGRAGSKEKKFDCETYFNF